MEQYAGISVKMRRKFHLDREASLDLFADAVIALITQIESGTYKGDSKLSTYFYRIFYNKCVDLLRKNTTNTVELDDNQAHLSVGKSELEHWHDRFQVEEIKVSLDKMGDPCRQILMDWGFWGYNMKEIAAKVGYSTADQAKKRKYKCLKQLRELIKQNN